MTLHHATKLIIITEKLIEHKVCDIIESCGASGYTLVAAGGQGSHEFHFTSERATLVGDFRNVKIETIVNEKAVAEKIMHEVAEQLFNYHYGITYLEQVEILRPAKFEQKSIKAE